MDHVDWGAWSLLPLLATLVIAFLSRSALIATITGVFIVTLMLGAAPDPGLNQFFQSSLGNVDFIWICEIVVLIGILFELFKRAADLTALAELFTSRKSRRPGVSAGSAEGGAEGNQQGRNLA